jgi:hypothetical protein
MVDVMLMQARMKRCRTKPTSWIVGDIDQLPSVGPGQLLGLSRPSPGASHLPNDVD